MTKKLFVIGTSYCVIELTKSGYWIAHEDLNTTVLKHHFPIKNDRLSQLMNAEIIGGVEYRVDYLAKEKSTLKPLIGDDHLKWIRIVSNPIKDWKLPKGFKIDEDIRKEYFDVMFAGKIPDIIDIVALSIIHGEDKLNKMLLVGPSNIGKTLLMELLGFLETETDEFNNAITSVSGLSKERAKDFYKTGLIHIDDVRALADELKNTKDTVKLKVMNKGKVTIPCKFLAGSTTDDSIVLGEGTEWDARILHVEIPYHENKVPKSKLYRADADKYQEHTAYALKKMIKEAFEQEPNQDKLTALQDKYTLENVSDAGERNVNIIDKLMRDNDLIVKFENGRYGVRGRIPIKVQVKQLFSDSFVDKPKSFSAQVKAFYNKLFEAKNTGVLDGEKFTDVFYFREEFQDKVIKTVPSNLDENNEEVTEFLG